MLGHDVGDILEHLKREHIEVRGILITVSDCLSERIEILVDIPVELDAVNTRNGGRYLLITIPVLIGILCMPFAIKSWSRRMKA